MGYYIPNNEPVQNKGAEPISQPKSFDEVPEDKALICEVDNMIFKANGLIYSEREFKDFSLEDDSRPKRWFLMDKTKAHELAGYNS